ncbi:hypothetical protein GWI33_017553 [Rhynchophorus ferrugineus]|uniref:Uncharacterized protein n=1 Tax=Rhynchophorus ferrugineus TaxID=354439 RepID=A0A834HY06_RHYFE|nr:hypothetical protein GWI33_017553 [Rhynchophorus ferrugineus]
MLIYEKLNRNKNRGRIFFDREAPTELFRTTYEATPRSPSPVAIPLSSPEVRSAWCVKERKQEEDYLNINCYTIERHTLHRKQLLNSSSFQYFPSNLYSTVPRSRPPTSTGRNNAGAAEDVREIPRRWKEVTVGWWRKSRLGRSDFFALLLRGGTGGGSGRKGNDKG